MAAVKRVLFGGPGGATVVADVGLLVLRLVTGLLLALGHGWGKLPPPEGFVSGVGKLGFPQPTLFAWGATLAEFAGGLLIAIGLLTRPAALFVAFTMLTAAFLQHASDPWFMSSAPGGGSKEPALLFLGPALALLLMGAGRFSIDALIAGGRRGRHGRGFAVGYD